MTNIRYESDCYARELIICSWVWLKSSFQGKRNEEGLNNVPLVQLPRCVGGHVISGCSTSRETASLPSLTKRLARQRQTLICCTRSKIFTLLMVRVLVPSTLWWTRLRDGAQRRKKKKRSESVGWIWSNCSSDSLLTLVREGWVRWLIWSSWPQGRSGASFNWEGCVRWLNHSIF